MIYNDRKTFSVLIIFEVSIAQTTPNSSNSFTEYFSSEEFKNLEAYAIATQPFDEF